MQIREVSLQYVGEPVRCEPAFHSPDAVYAAFHKLFGAEPRERFVAFLLDARHRPMAAHTVSLGTLTASLVHPREVFRAAIEAGAAAIILAHNHPEDRSFKRGSASDKGMT